MKAEIPKEIKAANKAHLQGRRLTFYGHDVRDFSADDLLEIVYFLSREAEALKATHAGQLDFLSNLRKRK